MLQLEHGSETSRPLGMTDWPTDRPGHREASLSINKKVMIYIHGWGMLNDT